MSKASKQRHCPATGGVITPAECGTMRHSRYACPSACPHNPLAPDRYTALLEIEDRLDAALFRRLLAEDDGAAAALAEASRQNSVHGLHAVAVWRMYFRSDREGRTVGSRWEAAGFPGLKNDEAVLLRAKMQTRVALLEIDRILDAQTIEAVDLLDSSRPRLRFIDRQIAARAVRFAAVLTWIYPLPHFWRLSGTGILLPEYGSLDPAGILDECVAHLGGPKERTEGRARWLAENFIRIDDTLTAAALMRRQRMFAEMDAQFGSATYELCASFRQCRAALVADPAVVPDELSPEERAEGLTEALVWFDPPEGPEPVGLPAEACQVKGRILLGRKQWRLEAIGAVRFAGLRAEFEARLGARVRFTHERRDDLGARVAGGDPPVDATAVPPRLLEQPMALALQSSRIPGPPVGMSLEEYQAQMAAEHRRAWLDLPVPALDGLTPRAAALVPALRPKLLHLMKGHVRQLDEENLRTGRSDDINDCLRELGLFELDVPPPPPRAIPPEEPEAGEEDGEDEADYPLPPEAGRPAPPRLVGAPLTLPQAVDRLGEVIDSLATARSGLEEMDRSGATVIQDAAEFSMSWMTEEQFNYLVPFVLQAWFVLVPKGVRAPELRFEAMAAAMVAEEARPRLTRRGGRMAFEQILRECRQPGLLEALMGGLMELADNVPENMRPSPEATIGMIIVLKVILDELDHALRA